MAPLILNHVISWAKRFLYSTCLRDWGMKMGSLLFASKTQKSQIITDTRFDNGIQTTDAPFWAFPCSLFMHYFSDTWGVPYSCCSLKYVPIFSRNFASSLSFTLVNGIPFKKWRMRMIPCSKCQVSLSLSLSLQSSFTLSLHSCNVNKPRRVGFLT
jgi:hypothetical protein